MIHDGHDRDGLPNGSSPASRRAQFEIDEDLCTGCSLCEERAPENLQMTTGGRTARVVKQPDSEQEEEACIEAADYCPSGGISKAEAESPAAGAESHPLGTAPPTP